MNAAFIPVRGGSRSIPLKNIKPMAGRPLVYWTVKAACDCRDIDRVYISTDSDVIKSTVRKFKDEEGTAFSKICFADRSDESAGDTAPTEKAMLEFAEQYDFENIVLIQATSPLLSGNDLCRGFMEYRKPDTDSVLSVVRQKRFHWTIEDSGFCSPVNYDVHNRPRRQEFEGCLVENGAFYITSRERLLRTGDRISGNIRCAEMDGDTYFEIDEPSDWNIVEMMLEQRIKNKDRRRIPEIKMFLTDCDGCLTDGGMYYSEKGDELKKFHAGDGMGLRMLQERGIITGIVTSEETKLNRRRAEKLHLDVFVEKCSDKKKAIEKVCMERGIAPQNTAYVGDDLNDLEAIKFAGFGCSVRNGQRSIKECAEYVSEKNGGDGAVREIIDYILENMDHSDNDSGEPQNEYFSS